MESDAHKAQRETEAGARRAVSPGLRLSRDIPVAGNRDKQWGQQAESRPAAGNVCPRPTPLPSGAPPQPQRHTQPGAGCWLLSRLDFSEVRPGRSAAPLHALLGSALRSPARERVPEAWSRTRVPPKTPPSSPVPSGPRRALRGSRSHRPQRGWRRSGPTWHRHEVPPHPHRPQPGGTRPGAAAVTAPSVATKLCGASSRARVGRENPELLAPLRRPTAGSPGPQFPHRFAQPMTGDPRDGAGKHRGRHLSRSTVPAALPTLRDARGGVQGGSSEFPAGCSTPPPPPHPAHLPSAPLSTAAASRHRRSRCRFHNGRGELKRAPGSGERGGVAQKPGPPAPPPTHPPQCRSAANARGAGKGWGGVENPTGPPARPRPADTRNPRPRSAPPGVPRWWLRPAMAALGAARDAATATGGGAAPFALRHLHLSLRVGFAAAGAGRLRGSARLELRCVRAGSRELVLDAHPALSVLGARLLPPGGAGEGEGEGEGRELRFESRPFASYGTALHLALPEEPRPGELLAVRIDYETGEGPGVSGGGAGGHGDTGIRGAGDVGRRGPRAIFHPDRVPSRVHAARCQRRRASALGWARRGLLTAPHPSAVGTERWGQQWNLRLTACCSACAAGVLAGLLPNGPEGETFPLYLWLPCAQQILLPRLPHPCHEEHLHGPAPGNAAHCAVSSLARCAGSAPSRPRGSRSPICTLKARPS